MSKRNESFSVIVPGHQVSVDLCILEEDNSVEATIRFYDKTAQPSSSSHDIELQNMQEQQFKADSKQAALDLCQDWIESNLGHCGRFIPKSC